MIKEIRRVSILMLTITMLSGASYAQWNQVGNDVDGVGTGDEFGGSVSLSDDGLVMAVGATRNDATALDAGHVRVFQKINGAWSQFGTDLNGAARNDLFGFSVSLSGDASTLAVGGIGNDAAGLNVGHVQIFENVGGTWSRIGSVINGEGLGDLFGNSVSLSDDGTIVAIGGKENDGAGSNHGHVRVFKNVNDIWTQVGADIDGENAGDYSGYAVSISGNGSIVAIGAPGNDAGGNNWGHVRVYKNVNDTWIKVGVDIDGEANGDESGSSVSLSNDGSIVAIAARNNDGGGAQSGHVRVYKNMNDTWTKVGADIDGESSPDYSGYSVSINGDGSIVGIGAAGNDAVGGTGANYGHVRVFENVNDNWIQVGSDIDGEAYADGSWSSVSLDNSGANLAVGAINNDGAGSNSGHVRVFSNSSIVTSIDKHNDLELSVYPNPSSAQLNIEAEEKIKSITVLDITGQRMEIINLSNKSIDISDFPKGIYMLQIQTEKSVANKRFVKN